MTNKEKLKEELIFAFKINLNVFIEWKLREFYEEMEEICSMMECDSEKK